MLQGWEILLDLLPRLLEGAVVTITVTLLALFIGLLFGVILAIVRVYGGKAAAAVVMAYVTVIRAVPPILSLFVLFFVVARLVDLSPLLSGIMALGLTSSAYQAEIIRGAINSVGASQMVAARAIGMSRLKAIRFIVLPQALRLALPPWSNETAQLLKQSSLVYALGVPEMLRQAAYVSARTLKPFIAYGTVAVAYFLMFVAATRGLNALERRLAIPTKEQAR